MAEILHKGIEQIPGPSICQILHTEEELVTQLKRIELAGRTCYRSEDKLITQESAGKFIKMLIRRGHLSVLEHSAITVKFSNVSRGFTHELVRHRLCAYSQESTRYVDYARKDVPGNEMEEIDLDRFEMGFVMPPHQEFGGVEAQAIKYSNRMAENTYRTLRKAGWSPEDARQFLPIGLATRIVVTANFRQWRHIFELRTAKTAHWEIRCGMMKLLVKLQNIIPEVFFDFEYQGKDKNGVPFYKKIETDALEKVI